MDVIGNGNLIVETRMGKRFIKEVMLVLGLKEILLSIGHVMEYGYYLMFGGNKVEIYGDSSFTTLIAKIPMKGNVSFLLNL